MIRKTLFAAAALALLAGPVYADNYSDDIAKVDVALQSAQLSDADKAKVMELRTASEEQHNAGNDEAAVATLEQAKQILGIN
ncbi:MAG: hypothetical protein Q8P46_13125 [Hyphomicrobiales bacterium]|nr:hypothetical protein [Hyphomicrobiales bacterium]